MRSIIWILGLTGLATAGAVAQAGCGTAYEDVYVPLTDPKLATGTGGTPAGCAPSTVTGAVADSCGVFVSVSGDDGNAGTKERPLKTIGAALGKGTAIYACAGAMPFSETVTISKKVTLFGALDCTTWGYDATSKTQLTAAADAVPLTLASTAGGSAVHDFAIAAADAMTAGGSSIAILDDGASVVLEGVSVTAGAGAPGAAGMVQGQVVTPAAANGTDGADDVACNNMTGVLGGVGGKNTCVGMTTGGGVGGDGLANATGGDGSGGQPMTSPSNAGSGQTVSCEPGGVGNNGGVGSAGTGARGIGDVSSMGYAGPSATLAGPGTPGQGGGGGGGAHACDTNDMFAGPSGGGGGAGGCAGAPGNAGSSGGSSIGILALGATVTLTTVSIATHDGGAGGTGGDGQPGGAGGQPGNAGGANSCGGGKGGQGGAGGPGGGGAGGHSIAVAFKGGTAPSLSSTTLVPGMGGTGGPGGDKDMTAQTKGDDGMACKTLDFTTPASTTACAM